MTNPKTVTKKPGGGELGEKFSVSVSSFAAFFAGTNSKESTMKETDLHWEDCEQNLEKHVLHGVSNRFKFLMCGNGHGKHLFSTLHACFSPVSQCHDGDACTASYTTAPYYLL